MENTPIEFSHEGATFVVRQIRDTSGKSLRVFKADNGVPSFSFIRRASRAARRRDLLNDPLLVEAAIRGVVRPRANFSGNS